MMTKTLGFKLWGAVGSKNRTLQNPKIDYLTGIEQNDPRILKMIYQQFLGATTKFVLKNNGTKDDAMDVFQEALMVVCKKLKQNELVLTAAFGTYLFSICRFIWLRELKLKRRTEMPLPDKPSFASDIDIERAWMEGEKRQLIQSKMKQLTHDSQKVLNCFFNGLSMKEIAREMNYTPAYAQRKKYLAQKQLITLVKKDPLYREFMPA